jgi:hypothetical protein
MTFTLESESGIINISIYLIIERRRLQFHKNAKPRYFHSLWNSSVYI